MLCKSTSGPAVILDITSGAKNLKRPESEKGRWGGEKEKNLPSYLDLFQVFVAQVLERIDKVLFDFNIQRVFHFSQSFHSFTSIKKCITCT